jgi:hypothetical protein
VRGFRSRISILNHSSRVAHNGRSGSNVPGHHRPGANDRIFSDSDSAQDRGPAANTRTSFHDRGDCFPIIIGLQKAFVGSSARNFIVDEDDTMANEDFILNRDTFADETVTRDLTLTADAGPLLNFDEGANPAFIANFAAVKVYEVMDDDVATQFDVGRNNTELFRHYFEDLQKLAVAKKLA